MEMLARRWSCTAETYIRNRDDMTLIRYEDFLKDKTGAIQRLAKQLGLSEVHDISTKIDIQYQSRGDHNIRWNDFFGIRNLKCIEQICNKQMMVFGYSVE